MKKAIFAILLIILCVPSSVRAQESATFTKWEDLIPYIESLERRIETLESTSSPANSAATSDQADYVPNPDEESRILEGKKVGQFIIGINKFEFNQTRDGRDVLTLYIQFTNDSSETVDFWEVGRTAFQNGIEIEEIIETPLYSNWDRKIRPGRSIEVTTSFVLFDQTNEFEVEFKERSDYDAKPVLFVLDLAEVAGGEL